MAINNPLPDDIRNKVLGVNSIGGDTDALFGKFMKPLLDAEGDSSLFLSLDGQPDKVWPKPRRHYSKKLTYKQRRKLGLYSLGRDSLKYQDLLPLHFLWTDYIKKYINISEFRPKGEVPEKDIEPIAVKLFRADYHGAQLTVKRSLCPGYVGKTGIVAMETKNCFLLVGQDNVTRNIPKASCEFSFVVNQYKFSFFGKNFISRPADRSSKKIKTIYPPCL